MCLGLLSQAALRGRSQSHAHMHVGSPAEWSDEGRGRNYDGVMLGTHRNRVRGGTHDDERLSGFYVQRQTHLGLIVARRWPERVKDVEKELGSGSVLIAHTRHLHLRLWLLDNTTMRRPAQ